MFLATNPLSSSLSATQALVIGCTDKKSPVEDVGGVSLEKAKAVRGSPTR